MAELVTVVHDTTENWAQGITPLPQGTWGLDTKTREAALGDGTTLWPDLPKYVPGDANGVNLLIQDADAASDGTPDHTLSSEMILSLLSADLLAAKQYADSNGQGAVVRPVAQNSDGSWPASPAGPLDLTIWTGIVGLGSPPPADIGDIVVLRDTSLGLGAPGTGQISGTGTTNAYSDLGCGTSDDKALIEAGVAAINAAGGGTLLFPMQPMGQPYRFSNLVIDLTSNAVKLEFAPGVLMRPISSSTGPAITITSSAAVSSGTNFNRGLRIKGLKLVSGTYIMSPTQIDRVGMLVQNTAELGLEDCTIAGFGRQGLQFDGCWDGRFRDLTMYWCGHATSSSDYAYALDMAVGTVGGGSNANIFTGLHIEQAPLGIHLTGGARLNEFLGAKYETGQNNPNTDGTHSPVWLEDVTENTFTASHFTSDITINTWFIMGNQLPNTYETNAYARRNTVFLGCHISSNQSGSANNWILPANGSHLTFDACTFNRVNGGAGIWAFRLHEDSKVVNSTIATISNHSALFQVSDPGVHIEGNTYIGTSNTSGGAEALYLFDAAYDDVVIRGNRENLTVTNPVDGPSFLGADLIQRDGTITSQGASPEVFGTTYLGLTNSSAVNVTNFSHGYAGQMLFVHANDGNTTLVQGGSMSLKNTTTRTMQAGENTIFVCSGSGVWREH